MTLDCITQCGFFKHGFIKRSALYYHCLPRIYFICLYGYKMLNHLSLQYISNLFASNESRFPKPDQKLLLIPVDSCNRAVSTTLNNLPFPLTANEKLQEKKAFTFHVKHILSDRCFHCHGPDENARQADLRLDLEEEAFAKLTSGNGYALVSGSVSRSTLVDRILTDDPEIMMPPPESHLSLSEEEKAILIKWIRQGAEWKNHWAFSTPTKPELPTPTSTEITPLNPFDNFVFAKLEQEKLFPSKAASKERLIRRVSLDLT